MSSHRNSPWKRCNRQSGFELWLSRIYKILLLLIGVLSLLYILRVELDINSFNISHLLTGIILALYLKILDDIHNSFKS